MKSKAYRTFCTAAYSHQLEQRMLLSVQPLVQAVQPDALAAAVNAALDNAPAGDPIYMKYGGITGDVTTPGFAGDIQLNSFQWGVGRGIGSPTGGSADREASAPSISEIVIGKKFDLASVPLVQQAFGGTPSAVEIDVVNIGADGTVLPYFKIDLSNTLISGYSLSSGGDRPSESLSLNFTKISFTSTSSTGQSQTFAYDLATQGGTIQPAALFSPQAPSSDGSDPIYMKYDNIKGGVTSPGANGEIEINSFQWGVSRSITGTGTSNREASAPSVSEIVVGKNFDSASISLIQETFVGKQANAEIDFANVVNTANGAIAPPYLKITLSNVLISSYSISSGGDNPTESLSLNFTKLSLSATQTKGPPQVIKIDLSKGGTIVSASAAAALDAAPSSSSDPIYMKYGNITGDETTPGAKGYIDVNSFQWGVSRTISSPTGGSADRESSAPSVSEIVITKPTDSASVPLIQQALEGQANNTPVEIDFDNLVKSAAAPYLKLVLSNVLISGFSMSSGGDRPTESLSLNFTKISFTAPAPKGPSQSFVYDLATQGGTITPVSVLTPQDSSSNSGSGGSDPIYVKYGSIQGEVTTKGEEGSVEVNSFQWGVSRTISSPTGGSADREGSTPSVSEIVVTKTQDSTSPQFMEQSLEGGAANVEADFANVVNGAAVPYLQVKLFNTMISGYSLSSGGDRPQESISLNFTKISLVYTQSTSQSESLTYDLATQGGTIKPVTDIPPRPLIGNGTAGVYVKYGGITGDVTTPGEAGSIEVDSFQWGVSRTISSPTGGSADRESSAPSISEIAITKPTDSASIPLLAQAFGGAPTPVEIDFAGIAADGSAIPYLELQLNNTLISSYSMSSGGDRPSESLSLNFDAISILTPSTNPTTGPQTFTYDLTTQGGSEHPAPPSAPSAPAASPGAAIFMKYGSIPGDVTTSGAAGDIEVNSFQWGVSRSITGTGTADRESSSPSVSEIVITKSLDSASVPLIAQAFIGQANNTPVEIDFDNLSSTGAAMPYFEINLSDVLISSYSMSSGGDRPSESLSLNFTQISFTAITSSGQLQTFQYDLNNPAGGT